MDSNSVILLINFILQLVQMIDHSIFKRLSSSKCFGAEIVLKDRNDLEDPKKENTNNKI